MIAGFVAWLAVALGQSGATEYLKQPNAVQDGEVTAVNYHLFEESATTAAPTKVKLEEQAQRILDVQGKIPKQKVEVTAVNYKLLEETVGSMEKRIESLKSKLSTAMATAQNLISQQAKRQTDLSTAASLVFKEVNRSNAARLIMSNVSGEIPAIHLQVKRNKRFFKKVKKALYPLEVGANKTFPKLSKIVIGMERTERGILAAKNTTALLTADLKAANEKLDAFEKELATPVFKETVTKTMDRDVAMMADRVANLTAAIHLKQKKARAEAPYDIIDPGYALRGNAGDDASAPEWAGSPEERLSVLS
mmetsp:Transcript_11724/g.29452  ORF Transcript_11724/g.29452 Transcript_11724/m.29452 type:complete len:307 (+) Transcript_11724:110-1030(+)